MSGNRRRVVVTGMGIISPIGIGNDANLASLKEGKSGVGLITRFDTTNFDTKIAAEVKDFDPKQFIEPKSIKQMDTFIQYALAGTKMAMEQSGLKIDESNAERVGVVVGAGLGGLPEIEETHKKVLERGPGRISPFFIPRLIANLAPGQISIVYGAKGPNMSIVTACTTGTHSIGEAYRMIQRDEADAMIAGGCEATITPLCVGGFSAMRALSERNDEPTRASRPFDLNRDGFVVGEGAGILILEELESAQKRGAKIYAELVGYGSSGDASHITSPSEGGEGAQRCMKNALRDAGLNPDQIVHINSHGTSTPIGDKFETMAIKSVFGSHAKKIKVNSTKSMTGHLLGAAGGVEAVFSVMAIHHNFVPPTINYETPDPECDLDYTPNKAVEMKVETALSNSFGFGGTNGTLIFKKFQ
ncbi:MAG: beta-ketoacyl-ACP synthase II [Bdellovibrionota bacterium]